MVNTEHAHRFGRAAHLVGIVGLPASASAEIGVIVLNAGLVHRIGPFRLHVELARRLNAAGYPSLRFDLSTLGDSSASGEAASRVQQVRADVSDAIALLRKESGCRQFVLIGLCSGAENAHRAAAADASIVGAVFLDGYAYRSTGFKLRYYLPKLLNPARLTHSIARRLGKKKTGDAEAKPSFGVVFPPIEEVRQEMAGMLDRGAHLYFIYSGGASNYFNHRRQFHENYGKLAAHAGVEVERLEETDHTYILTGDRSLLLDKIDRWMRQHFPHSTRPTS
jgi:pimeloyl-ACP methyl ester carboxylesterase